MRKATIEDLSRCIELLKEEDFRYCSGEYPNENWISEFFNEHFYVLEIDNKIIGCYLATNIFLDGIYIWYISVDISFRNKGYGDLILKEMENIHKEQNKNWFYFISPLKNIDFYTKRNFIPHHSVNKEFYKEF